MLLLYVCLVWFSGKGMAQEKPGNWWDGWGQYNGIVKIGHVADPTEDAKKLHFALDGWGPDTNTINNILIGRTNNQREELSSAYFDKYAEDLIKILKDTLRGDHKKLIVSVMLRPDKFFALQLHNAMKGLRKDESVISEVFATHSPDELWKIADTYKIEFHRSLIEDLKDETSGNYLYLLTAILEGKRGDPSTDVDEALVTTDVKTLHAAKKWILEKNEEKFIDILGARSGHHLLRVFKEYKKRYGLSIEEAIESEISGAFQQLALALVSATKDFYGYFAGELYNAMKGLGTDEDALTRICVGRSEIDLPYIIAKFEEKFGISFSKMVEEETSGPYGLGLLALINS